MTFNLDFMKPAAPAVQDGRKWYELSLADFRDMQDYQRDAHIRSMQHSQKSDYGCDLRLVLIPERDNLQAGADPWEHRNYRVPGLSTALQVCREVVIRHDGKEFVAKSADSETGFRDRTGAIVAQTAAEAPVVRPQTVTSRPKKVLDL